VISILQERISFFRYLINVNGDFSFRDYISEEGRFPGSLFLMNIRNYDAIFRPLMTFVVDIMIREVLSLPDSFTRRITFLIDEFGSLSKLPAVFDFLTMARSKGGFLVIANQDLGSVANIYGNDQKETFFNNFNVHLTFRLNDPTTAEFLSKAFGEREVVKKFRSSSFSPTDVGDRFTLGEQEKLEKVVLPTEFQNLPDFHTFLKIANYGTARMETKKEFMTAKAPEFVIRDFSIEEIVESDRQAKDEAAALADAEAKERKPAKTPDDMAAEMATAQPPTTA
jgi:type IV secretory pathway TraG/TraD family ATPase VirD4